MPDTKKQQMEKFNTVDECIEFLYDLFETEDYINYDDFGALLSLMLGREVNSHEIGFAVDGFYEKYRENQPT